MAFVFNRTTYENQLQKLEKAEEWFKFIGIQADNTRFEEVLLLNRDIVEHHNNNRIDALISKYGNLKLWFALTEASSFIEIYEAFFKQKSHLLPRKKLKMLLQGPYHSWDERVDENNIEPRNILFELEVAAKFFQAGVKITDFDDVDFIFKKTKFNVQCKRLHSEKKIRDNITEAAAQISKRMRKKTNLKGIICLSIDKLTGKEEMLLKVSSPSEVSPRLAVLSNSILDKYRYLWQHLVNTNILAVIIFMHAVATIEDHPYDLLTTCREIAFDVIPHQAFYQKSDYELIVELGERLQKGNSHF